MFCLIWVTDVQCLYSIIAQNRAPQGKRIINWRFKFGFKNLNFILSPFLWWLITDFYKKLTIFDEMAKVHKLNILKRKKCIRNKHTEIEISKLLLDLVISQTHQGLKRVTIICLLSLMLINIHFRKYHIWNDKTYPIQLDIYKSVTQFKVNCTASNLTHLFHLVQFVKC